MKMKLSQTQRKLITSLRQKKYRAQYDLFVAEGVKVVTELLHSRYMLHKLFVTDENLFSEENFVLISEKELSQISSLKSPNKVLAIFKIPKETFQFDDSIILALDSLNDPGNLGTIIRMCDWFGITEIICSKDSVDCYNPKVVQASMGSLARVSTHYLDLYQTLKETNTPILTTDMDGQSIYHASFPKKAILVMGNEANGISSAIQELSDAKLTIPRYGNLKQTESLNVAVATSIVLSEIRRRTIIRKPD